MVYAGLIDSIELMLMHCQDWTIIRPGALKNNSPTGKAILTEDVLASGSIDRVDCAELIIKVLGTPGLATRRELTAVDPTSSPDYNYVPFIL